MHAVDLVGVVAQDVAKPLADREDAQLVVGDQVRLRDRDRGAHELLGRVAHRLVQSAYLETHAYPSAMLPSERTCMPM